MGKYKIYHIPKFVYPSGHIGKVGCTKLKIEKRIQQNTKLSMKPFDFWEVLEEYDCKKTAGKREKELQIEYGYKQDQNEYASWTDNENVKKGQRIGGSRGGKAVMSGPQGLSIRAMGGKMKREHSAEFIRYIRQLHSNGSTLTEIYKRFNLNPGAVSNILNYKTYKDI